MSEMKFIEFKEEEDNFNKFYEYYRKEIIKVFMMPEELLYGRKEKLITNIKYWYDFLFDRQPYSKNFLIQSFKDYPVINNR